jgi:rhamnulokinase
MIRFLAFDLGAESGRAILGHFDGQRLELEEIHRFANSPVQVSGHLYWDVLRLWSDIKLGLSKASQTYGDSLQSVGLDTWGVDFGLLASDDNLIGNPVHYRDSRTNGVMEKVFLKVPRAEIYAETGIQFMQLNSLYQLYSMVLEPSPSLAAAKTFLNMPDLFNFWLSGRKASEFTIATTTQCYNPVRRDWAWNLLERLEIPSHIFQPLIQPCTVLDRLRPAVAEETGCGSIPVVAPACHDTGCAVLAVPTEESDYIYLSSGTWSLMGVEIDQPVINNNSLTCDLTNEGGVNGKFRFLKNIMGMWLLQECRREWSRLGRTYSYDDLTRLAEAAPAFGPLILTSDPCFLAPGNMPIRIQSFCRETGQDVPQEEGAIARCIFESLALEYRWVAERIDDLLGRRMQTVHVIGGGSRNKLLNQFTADATGRKVVSGPVEAITIGNLMAQALAMGVISSTEEVRSVVRRSFDPVLYVPEEQGSWEEKYQEYLDLREKRLEIR